MAMSGRKVKVLGGIIIVFCLLFPGCRGGLLNNAGQTVSEERRIPLRGGEPWAGRLETADLTVEYRCGLEGSVLDISGSVDLSRKTKIWRFSLMLHFSDSAGVVLRGQNLASAGYKTMGKKMAFRQRVAVPPRAAFISFSYSGTASGTGRSGSPTDFWLFP